jgi:hypothetical protein
MRWQRRRPEKTAVDLQRAQGVQVGDNNVQTVHFHGGSREPTPLDRGADRLAEGMHSAWLSEARHRGIVTPAPASVRWRWAPPDVSADSKELTDDVAGSAPSPLPGQRRDPVLLRSGVVTRLHDELYARLPHGRLVLLGTGGAGKTGAMILLLLAALDARRSLPAAERGRVPVPVWLTLGGWDPSESTLSHWAAETIRRDHPYLRASDFGTDAVNSLLANAKVALFLDGLDEMPEAVRSQALSRLDEESGTLRMVLSSRPDEYRHALTEGRLHNAAVIEIRPVRPRSAAEFLLRDQLGPQQAKWQHVVAELQADPQCVATRALDNPLTLSLARAVYVSRDPSELLDPKRFPSVTAVRAHLIERILPTAYPNPRERARAQRWLGWVAHHVDAGRDIAWWRIPAWIPRWQVSLVILAAGMAAGILAGLAASLYQVSDAVSEFRHPTAAARPYSSNLIVGLTQATTGFMSLGAIFGLIFSVLLLIVTGPVARTPREPLRIVPRRLGLHDTIRLLRVIAASVLLIAAVYAIITVVLPTYDIAMADGITTIPSLQFAELADPNYGLAASALIGIPAGLLLGLNVLWTVPAAQTGAASPSRTYQQDRRTSRQVALAVLITAIGTEIIYLYLQPLYSLWDLPLLAAIAIAPALAIPLATGSAPVLFLVELIVGRVVHPPRFMRLFEDAVHRQVLRQAGSVYQFRHAELQDHLARLHHSRQGKPAVPSRASPQTGARRRNALKITVAFVSVVALAVAGTSAPSLFHPDHTTLDLILDGDRPLLAISPNGDTLAIADCCPLNSQPASAGPLWLVRRSSNRLTRLDTIDGPVVYLTFNRSGDRVAALQGPIVQVFDASTGNVMSRLPVSSNVTNVAFSSDGGTLAIGGKSPSVRLIDPRTATTIGELRGASAEIGDVAYSPDGRLLAGEDVQGGLWVWRLHTGALYQLATSPHPGSNDPSREQLAFDPTSRRLAVIHSGSIGLWDLDRNTRIREIYGGAVSFSPDGTRIAVTDYDYDGRIVVQDVATGNILRAITSSRLWLSDMAFTPDWSTVAAVGSTQSDWVETRVRVWHLDVAAKTGR